MRTRERIGDDLIENWTDSTGRLCAVQSFGYFSEEQIRNRKIAYDIFKRELIKTSPLLAKLWGEK